MNNKSAFGKNVKSGINSIEEEDLQQIRHLNESIIERANRFVYSIDWNFPEVIRTVAYKESWNID